MLKKVYVRQWILRKTYDYTRKLQIWATIYRQGSQDKNGDSLTYLMADLW